MKLLSIIVFLVPRSSFLIMISLSLIMMTGCGKKGPVRPKLDTVPEAPRELTLQQQGRLFVLGWTIPTQNQDGSRAEDLVGFRINRLDYDGASGCPTCREPQLEVAELDLAAPQPGQRIGNRVYWRDLDIRPGSGYRYAVIPLTVGGGEGPAATIHLAVQQPPASPSKLQLEAGDRQVKLQWSAPPLAEGFELVGYNLYRRQAKRSFSIVPVNAEPLQTTTLLDRGLDNGRAYEYRVSTLVRIDGQLLESVATPGALITPQRGF